MTTEPREGWVGGFLSNSTFFLSALYLFATAIGVIYSWFLYGSFGINIFDYSEIGDFLLAAFKNPLAFLPAAILTAMALGLAVYAAISDTNIRATFRGAPDLEEVLSKRQARVAIIALILVSVGVVPSLVLPYFFARNAASSIKNGQNAEVTVQYRSFKGSAGQVTVPRVELIGATQKAAFFYDSDDKRTLVIPQAQLVSIEMPK